MNRYHVAWLIWCASFFAIELPAFFLHRGQGDTLSECVWRVFAVNSKQHRFWKIRRIALLAFMGWLCLHFLTAGAWAQNAPMFTVQGQDKHYSEVEATRAYWYAVEALRLDLHATMPLTPAFTLVLGSNKNGLDYDKREVDLKKWDRQLFEQAVFLLAIDELKKPEYLKTLLTRIEAQQNASVGVETLKK